MPWEAWFVLILAVVTVFVTSRSYAPPDGAFVLAAIAIALASVVSGRQHGGHALLPSIDAIAQLFGAPILWSIVALFIVAKGLGNTGAADLLAGRILGVGGGDASSASGWRALMRATPPLMALAPFLSNTATMAILLPVTTDWCRRHRVSPAKLLLPLNYLKMLGAMCCMLGTTSNLVVAALMQQSKNAGVHPLGLFDIAYVGVPCALIGGGYILFVGFKLLPDRRPGVSETNAIKEYSVSVCVVPRGPLDGKSVADAGLRSLPGLYLIEIERAAELITVVGPSVVLRADDRLTFVGDLDSVVDLRKMRGLASEDRQREKLSVPPPADDGGSGAPKQTSPQSKERVLIEVVVSPECPLVGKSVREGRFRAHYGAAIIAIARGAQRLTGKIGDIVLQVGDTLVLETRPAFLERARRNRDFFLASKVEGFVAPKQDRAMVSIAILVAMVLATTLFDAPFFLATLIAAAAMVVTGCINVNGARAAVEWRVILTIGATFALGEAMRTSGAASGVAGALVDAIGAHPHVALGAVYLMTALVAELVTHTAAAALMFPLAVAAADRLGVSPMPFAVIVLIGASCSFMTPFGYQTNLMIMGPGGYEFRDYVRFGAPLTVLVGCVAVAIAPFAWPFS